MKKPISHAKPFRTPPAIADASKIFVKFFGGTSQESHRLDMSHHLVKEGTVLSRDSRSSEKFVYGIRALMSQNYRDNLSEEVQKGMNANARLGIWPTVVPLGYKNIMSADGRKIIVPDPVRAPLVQKLLEWYASEDYAIRDLAKKARAHDLTYKSGNRITKSSVHAILRYRLYTGWFEWKGRLLQEVHDPLVSVQVWTRVQKILGERSSGKHPRRRKREFAFSKLMTCATCGSAIVAEIKKGICIYYYCTGQRGDRNWLCRRKHVREEVLERQFHDLLGLLTIDDEVLAMLNEALRSSSAGQWKGYEEAIRRFQDEYKRLDNIIQTMCEDRLAELISKQTFNKKSRMP